MMTLRHLQIFYMVCKEESITAASEKLNMTQPAVSIAIKEIEAFYNTKLFERMNRRIYITEQGRILLQYADTIISQFNKSIDIIRNEKRTCECRIGVNVTIAETTLSNFIKVVEENNSYIDIKISIDNSENIEKMLADNEIDLAIVDKIEDMKNWKSKLIYQEKMIVISAPSSNIQNISISELSQKRLLLREKGSGNRSNVEAVFLQHGLDIVPFVESTSSLSLIRMAQQGLGYTILPKKIVHEYLIEGSLIEYKIHDCTFSRQYFLIYHKNKYLSATMKIVIDILDNFSLN